ncbi:MAG: hypothetical protein U9O24_00450 [Campylobacterota bacterium]|nr:hypothetical protein [Campylobacterota bacterium]
MTKIILIVLSTLTIVSVYATYTGMGLQGVDSENTKSSRSGSRSYGSGYSSGWNYGK